MPNDDRSNILEAEFTAPPAMVAGRPLRPFSVGSLNLCYRLGLTLLTGEGDEATMTDQEKQEQVLAFVFIQTEPVERVLLAAANANSFREKYLLPWSMDLPVSAIPEASEAIQAVVRAAQASVVEVTPKPGDKPEDAPPNS